MINYLYLYTIGKIGHWVLKSVDFFFIKILLQIPNATKKIFETQSRVYYLTHIICSKHRNLHR